MQIMPMIMHITMHMRMPSMLVMLMTALGGDNYDDDDG